MYPRESWRIQGILPNPRNPSESEGILAYPRNPSGAEESYRIGLLNHLVPSDQLKAKTMEIATAISGNRRESVMGVKALLLQHMGQDLEGQWNNEHEYTTNVVRGYKADQAFPEFIARKGRSM